MSHHVVGQIVAFHFYYRLQFLLCIVFGFLYVHRDSSIHWLLALFSDLQFVVQTHDWIFGLVLNLFKALVYVCPEVLTEYFLVIKSIANQAFDLFLDGSIKVFKRVWNYLFFLVFKRILNWFSEFHNLSFNPLRFVADSSRQVFKFFNYARLDLFNCLDTLFLNEMFVYILYKFLKTLFRYHSDLVWETQFDLSF